MVHPSCSAPLRFALVAVCSITIAACTGRSTATPTTTTSTTANTTANTTSTTAASAASAADATTAAPATGTATTTTPTSGPAPAHPDPLAIVVSPAVEPTAPTVDGTLRTADGRDRTYHVYVPAGLPPGVPVPLLVALHGGTGWGQQFERNSGFDGLAEANGFVVVYPDGIGVGAGGTALRTWNGGACCGPAVKQQVDDVGFIGQLIDALEATYDIDPSRVFAAGHSNGGILAYRLACELSDRIAAIGVQSTALEIATCTPGRPVSVLHIHGAADQNIPIDGGVGPKAISGVSFNRPFDAAVTLAAADGCPEPPVVTTAPSNPDLTISAWASCAAGAEVDFVEVAGASHAWMGHTVGGSGAVGAPYDRLDSSLLIWNFLSQHGRG